MGKSIGEKLYRKVGKKYKQVGWEFAGWPCDGIWLVHGGVDGAECLIKLYELGSVPVHALPYRLLKPELVDHLQTHWESKKNVGESLYGMAEAACDFFAGKVGK